MSVPSPEDDPADFIGEGSVHSTGFLLVDIALKPVYTNPEAVRILLYPANASRSNLSYSVIADRIREFFPDGFSDPRQSTIVQFQSGRRRYYCRAFALENRRDGSGDARKIAILLERKLSCIPDIREQAAAGHSRRENPFGLNPELGYFLPGRMHEDIFRSFHAGMRRRNGIGILLGKAGMGKTSFLQYFSGKLRRESEFLFFPGIFEDGSAVTRKVLSLLGIADAGADPGENIERLRQWLESGNGTSRHFTLVCDEAQYLSQDALLTLCNLAGTGEASGRLHLVLAGRQGLYESYLDLPAEMFRRNKNAVCRLAPMDEWEVSGYILHRLHTAGYSQPVFTARAVSEVAVYSRGIPLYVNMICGHALSVAASLDLKMVDEKCVADSAYDLVLSAKPFEINETPPGAISSRKERRIPRSHRGLKLVKKV
jgi:type II secretory pathway predicted ATPase ExeA